MWLVARMEVFRAEGPGRRKKYLMLLTDGKPNLVSPAASNSQRSNLVMSWTVNYWLRWRSKVLGLSRIRDAKILGTCSVNSISNILSAFAQQAVLWNNHVEIGEVLGGLPVQRTDWGCRRVTRNSARRSNSSSRRASTMQSTQKGHSGTIGDAVTKDAEIASMRHLLKCNDVMADVKQLANRIGSVRDHDKRFGGSL